jgi:hypothetical protein
MKVLGFTSLTMKTLGFTSCDKKLPLLMDSIFDSKVS